MIVTKVSSTSYQTESYLRIIVDNQREGFMVQISGKKVWVTISRKVVVAVVEGDETVARHDCFGAERR